MTGQLIMQLFLETFKIKQIFFSLLFVCFVAKGQVVPLGFISSVVEQKEVYFDTYVTIGSQKWLDHDLAITTYNDGSAIYFAANRNSDSCYSCNDDSKRLGEGQDNTVTIQSILSAKGIFENVYIFDVLDTYESGGFTDWFIPSKDELYKLYENKDLIGNFDLTKRYWTSNDYEGTPSTKALTLDFSSGAFPSYDEEKSKRHQYSKTRAVRYNTIR